MALLNVSVELIFTLILCAFGTFIYAQFFRVPGGKAKVLDDHDGGWKQGKDNKASAGSESDESDSDSSGSKNPLTILWGSQSGTAETFAGDLADEAKQHGYKAKVYDVEQYDKEKLAKEKMVIFVQATYGEGDPTDNAMDFFEWLKGDELQEGSLTNLKYAVFALGNRQYEKFCGAGVYLDNRLADLGGQRVMEVGQGDDDGSLSDDFDAWREKIWDALKKEMAGGDAEGGGSVDTQGDNKFHCHYQLKEVENKKYKSGIENFKPSDSKHKHVCVKVKENKELRKGNATDKDSSTRHIELDLTDSKVEYTTADNCYVWPANGKTLIDRTAKRFGIGDVDKVIELTTTKGKKPEKLGIPTPISYKDLFTWYMDVNSLASTKHVKLLQQYAEGKDEKAHTQLKKWLNDQEGKKQFQEQKYSLIELFEMFKNVNVPLIDVIETSTKLKARPYTISSSSVVQPKTLSITLSVAIDTNLPNGRRHEGTCTHYLRSLKPNEDRVWMYITPSTFRLPKAVPAEKKEKCVPVIMVGPGTGIAPFRAFMHEIDHIRKKDNLHIGPAILFTGCRNKKLDFIYEDELNEANEKKILDNLHLAFSRDNPDKSGKRRYVQHILQENGETIWKHLFEKKGYLYVCGGTAMGGAIRDSIVSIGEKYGNMSHERAKEYLSELQDKKRYIAELWS